jgi:hypothetical protein
MSIELTEEQRDQLKKQPNKAITVVDSETKEVFVLMQPETYRILISQQQPNGKVVVDYTVGLPPIPEGLRKSREAFLRDLPRLLQDERFKEKWVLYRGEKRLAVASTHDELMDACEKHGLQAGEYWTDKVVYHQPEPEEIDL